MYPHLAIYFVSPFGRYPMFHTLTSVGRKKLSVCQSNGPAFSCYSETKDWPKDWSKSIFLPIPKNGDSLECTNNRKISLVSHCSKKLLRIIAGRMKGKMEEEIAEEQCRFVPGKGTRDQVLNLKLTIEKNRERKKNLYLCFIDYRKACDTVAHGVLWKNMINVGFPKRIILLIKTLYESQTATIKTSYGLSDFFQIAQDVRQGCILYPSLFNIFSEQIMRTALDDVDRTIKVGGRKITNLRYPDDIVLISGSMNELTELTNKVHMASNRPGLHLNTRNTKVTKIIADKECYDDQNLVIGGEEVETVSNVLLPRRDLYRLL